MATPSPTQALKVRGRLCWDPTDLTGTYPFGGTALGLVRGTALRVRTAHHVIRAEEFGGAPVEALYTADEYTFVAILSSWDADAATNLLLDAAAGSTTSRPVVKQRPTVDDKRAGTLVSTQAGILYFSPDADQHPGVLMRRALPMPEESGTWQLSLAHEFGVPMVFLATPPDDGNPAVEVGLREDLTL